MKITVGKWLGLRVGKRGKGKKRGQGLKAGKRVTVNGGKKGKRVKGGKRG